MICIDYLWELKIKIKKYRIRLNPAQYWTTLDCFTFVLMAESLAKRYCIAFLG